MWENEKVNFADNVLRGRFNLIFFFLRFFLSYFYSFVAILDCMRVKSVQSNTCVCSDNVTWTTFVISKRRKKRKKKTLKMKMIRRTPNETKFVLIFFLLHSHEFRFLFDKYKKYNLVCKPFKWINLTHISHLP